MKRRPELLQLSREHHTALVLAKRAQRLAQGAATDAREFMDELPARFTSELEPHFQIEEIALLSALQDSHPENDIIQMVARTLLEHNQLRTLATRLGQQDFSSLAPFGELLGNHVRFEERELFRAAETLLSPVALSRIETACQQSGAGCTSALPS